MPAFRNLLTRPILIVSTPRSGSTLLFESLAQAAGLHTIGDESHGVIERDPALSPRGRGWTSNRLTAADATPVIAEELSRGFYERLRDRDGKVADGPVRMLEKTPKNALRVPFFDAIWPDSTFVYLYRDVRQSLSSMIEAWVSGRFRTYPRLPNWSGAAWSLLLVPGWEELNGLPVPQIVARQWATTTDILLDDLSQLPAERVRAVDYADLVAAPQPTLASLANSLDVGWDRNVEGALPLSKTTLSRPRPDKWKTIESVIEEVLPLTAEADRRARDYVARLSS